MHVIVSLFDRNAVELLDVRQHRGLARLEVPAPGRICEVPGGFAVAAGDGAHLFERDGTPRMHCRCCTEVSRVAARRGGLLLLCGAADSISLVDALDGALCCVRQVPGGVLDLDASDTVLFALCGGRCQLLILDDALEELAVHPLPCEGAALCAAGRWLYLWSQADRAALWCARFDPTCPGAPLHWQQLARACGAATFLGACGGDIVAAWAGGVSVWDAAARRMRFSARAGLVQGAARRRGLWLLADMEGELTLISDRGRIIERLALDGAPSGVLVL